MSLIIKDALPKFKKGYPTVSDKYDVAGAVLSGTSPLYFGQMVKAAATKGYFAAVDATQTIAAVTDIKGICLATNVKLNEAYGGDDVKTVPGEAFNLMIRGFMAIELAATATATEVVANAAVYATAAIEIVRPAFNQLCAQGVNANTAVIQSKPVKTRKYSKGVI